ncbi:hypothetical protein J4405_00565 [Candidatus Woesearchaeota archaeon]|nr:hypothetical protein [Candidatus Woesearchaeota archaeon]
MKKASKWVAGITAFWLAGGVISNLNSVRDYARRGWENLPVPHLSMDLNITHPNRPDTLSINSVVADSSKLHPISRESLDNYLERKQAEVERDKVYREAFRDSILKIYEPLESLVDNLERFGSADYYRSIDKKPAIPPFNQITERLEQGESLMDRYAKFYGVDPRNETEDTLKATKPIYGIFITPGTRWRSGDNRVRRINFGINYAIAAMNIDREQFDDSNNFNWVYSNGESFLRPKIRFQMNGADLTNARLAYDFAKEVYDNLKERSKLPYGAENHFDAYDDDFENAETRLGRLEAILPDKMRN